jgi:hypothetical protein
MQERSGHLSDEKLLQFIDRELPPRRQLRAGAHLAECPSCRSRRVELEGALAEFSDIYENTINSQLQTSHQFRSMLKDRMNETVARGHQGSPSRIFLHAISRQLVCAAVALLIVAAGGWTLHKIAGLRMDRHARELQALALPRRTLTPGVSRPVRFSDLCQRQDLDNDPPVDPSLQQAVFREYGLTNSSQNAYELDYLISPTLGGSVDIKNLWPQPYSSTWNARVKDQLENHLHELVCDQKVQLETVQNQLATDWIAAYKHYFNTDAPRSDSAALASRGAHRQSVRRGHLAGPVSGGTEIIDVATANPVALAALRLDQ